MEYDPKVKDLRNKLKPTQGNQRLQEAANRQKNLGRGSRVDQRGQQHNRGEPLGGRGRSNNCEPRLENEEQSSYYQRDRGKKSKPADEQYKDVKESRRTEEELPKTSHRGRGYNRVGRPSKNSQKTEN